MPVRARVPPDEPSFGVNAGLVDELYERYLADPASVADSWRDFFEDYKPEPPARPGPPAGGPETPAADRPGARAAGRPKGAPVLSDGDRVELLRGAAARVAENMTASLTVPTATSTRVVPARLLEVNRQAVNRHLGRVGSTKVSYTHLIGYAVVRALEFVPAMKSTYLDDEGGPKVVHHAGVGLGLAVDVVRSDGSRRLLVPVIRDADALDFVAFHAAYEDALRRVRSGRVTPEDFSGALLTLTNPGTLGTVASVPRLLAGQSAIIGVGAVGYPAEFGGADPRTLGELGVSKTVTLTSTYDHRVIQGSESGLFLGRVHELLLGADGFYDDVFRSLGVPYEAVEWRTDSTPLDRTDVREVKQVHVMRLINTYRVRGHLIADLDPLGLKEPQTHPELDPATLGLTIWDLEREFFVDNLAGRDRMTLDEILGVLGDAYCRRLGVEYMHMSDPDQKRWIQEAVEGRPLPLDTADQLWILDRLNAAEAFERFLHTKYVGHKRFGLEGAESLIPLLEELLDCAAAAGCVEAVMGMAHRGRLNVLANVVGKPLAQIFREFEGDLDPATTQGSGDVQYHVGAAGKFVGRHDRTLPVLLASNPSHLEAVDPVVEGMVRARQDLLGAHRSSTVVAVLIHGDAAFAGQGVVAETLNLSALRGYRVGGTVHIVVNNQLGFTTGPAEARSSVYPTDVAKMVQAPIFHVNGDDPEACVRAARLAFAFRQAFHKDVVIDMVCYRRHGHNEGDDPSYTQPLMYRRIESRRSVRKLYTETLVRRGDITGEEAERALEDFLARMQTAFDETRHASVPPAERPATPARPAVVSSPSTPTGVEPAALDRIVDVLGRPPEGFTVHPKLLRQLEARQQLYAEGVVDWSLGETLSMGSLLLEGTDVRLSGQDTRRGTLSQRHAVVVDYETGREWIPLEGLGAGQGHPWLYDSTLSEYAALGFEYGYSTAHPGALVLWEAQFGDFANGAQVIIDQFVAAAQDKWGQPSGLVLLLPHGFEGQGPEHSSARVERFLTLCAGNNLQVANPTTAAQYFHLLRRQARMEPRRPLVVLTPKSLLRARSARSALADLTTGGFSEVLDDPTLPDGASVRRVVLASGKVAHEALVRRDERGAPVAVMRLEQLAPWPAARLAEVLGRYPGAELVWLQEEPENMGPWRFVQARTRETDLRSGRSADGAADPSEIRPVTRPASPSPASGSSTTHQREQAQLLERAVEGA